jgi:hypothetical protein
MPEMIVAARPVSRWHFSWFQLISSAKENAHGVHCNIPMVSHITYALTV